MSLAIHTGADPRLLANAVQKQVSALDPDQPVYRIRTMQELMAESVARRRFSMLLLAIFAGVALLLAAVGHLRRDVVHGGATRARDGHPHGAGRARREHPVAGAGTEPLAHRRRPADRRRGIAALTRLLATMLFDVKATDPFTFVLVAAFLAVVAQIASFLPAWRATTIDPVTALRQE